MHATLRGFLVACAATCGTRGAGLLCAAAASIAIPNARAQDTQTLAYYVEAFVNGRDTGLIVRMDRRDDARLWIAADELSQIGIRVDNLALDADRHVALDDIPGLQHRYLENEQRIELTLPDDQLVPERIGYETPAPPAPTSATGLVWNYAAHLQDTRVSFAQRQNARRLHAPLLGTGRYGSLPVLGAQEVEDHFDKRNRTLSVGSELRLFSPIGVFVNSGYATADAGEYEYTRQDSYWIYSEVDSLRTWMVGDFVSSSLSWSRAVRLGGFSLSRNFAVRPDLVTFPVPLLGGSAVVPTTVDLYVNGLRQFSGQASGGPFVIATPPALTGAGRASVVYQDALGRQVTVNQPLYLDTRLLGVGLSDYAFQLGYPRRGYGSRSFDYADSPAANVSLRHGVSDSFTLEAHAELARGLRNAGIGGLLEVGHFGVLDAAVSVSDGDDDEPGDSRSDDDGSGTQISAGYRYQSPRFSLQVQGIRVHGDYRDIGSLEGVEIPQRQLHASLSVAIGHSQNLSLAYARQDASSLGGSRIVSLGYSGAFGTRVNLFANVFKDMDLEDSTGVFVGATVSLGERTSVSASASRYGDARTVSVSANRSVDYDAGGFGWNVLVDAGNRDYLHGSARLDYRGRYGEVSAQVEHADHADAAFDTASLFATGALVWLDGDLMASRTVYDAFAVASTGGLAGVPVLRENRLVGVTNRKGHVLIPDLLSYQGNRLAIDTIDLPAEVSVAADRMEIAPRALSGVLAAFPVGRYTGATVVLVDAAGQPLPVGTIVTVDGIAEPMVVGYDGEVFLPTLQALNRITATLGNATCAVEIPYREEDAMTTLGPFVCAMETPP